MQLCSAPVRPKVNRRRRPSCRRVVGLRGSGLLRHLTWLGFSHTRPPPDLSIAAGARWWEDWFGARAQAELS